MRAKGSLADPSADGVSATQKSGNKSPLLPSHQTRGIPTSDTLFGSKKAFSEENFTKFVKKSVPNFLFKAKRLVKGPSLNLFSRRGARDRCDLETRATDEPERFESFRILNVFLLLVGSAVHAS